MASAEFNQDAEEKRPTVQVGDPFTEKLLLEACLELMATDAIIAIQDMGAAGLTSSSAEMAGKGGAGIELDLDRVPQRESGMTAYDMMLSESQERMLMVLKPDREAEAEAIFRKWELDFAVIGVTTDTGRLVVKHKGAIAADIPVNALSEEAPVYRRPFSAKPVTAVAVQYSDEADIGESLLKLLASPDLCSRRWIWQQYDYSVMADTAQAPGGDAAVVRVHGTNKALAITTDVTPRYCRADPFEGAKQAVAEAWRNLTATGATPLAITDNLNFGNPERPETMAEIVRSIEGIAEACRALDFPVVSGNCSLYNETNGEAILPTPAIGAVGLIENVSRTATIVFKRAGDVLLLIGETQGQLGQSLYLREIEGREEGAPPPVDVFGEKRNGDFVRELINSGRTDTVHDVSDGGLLIAIAEMAMAGGMGAELNVGHAGIPFLFGEDQGRYVVAVSDEISGAVLADAAKRDVKVISIGNCGGDSLKISGQLEIPVSRLRDAHESWFPRFMSAPAEHF
jgi:phosphoribosylformylglycinamidine synthase